MTAIFLESGSYQQKIGDLPATHWAKLFWWIYVTYPSSHNHGSVKNECISNRIVTFLIQPCSTSMIVTSKCAYIFYVPLMRPKNGGTLHGGRLIRTPLSFVSLLSRLVSPHYLDPCPWAVVEQSQASLGCLTGCWESLGL